MSARAVSDPDLWDAVLTGGVVEAAPPVPPQKEQEEVPEMGVSPAAAGDGVFVPFFLNNDTDTSAMTDDQIEECFALAPPDWLREGATLEPTAANIARLGNAFVGKRTPVPLRNPGAEWHAEKRDLQLGDFNRHFSGKHLLGAYLLDEHDRTGVAVCDIDAEGSLKEGMLGGRYYPILDMAWWARTVGDALSLAMGSAVHVTLTGGKGAHAICVLPERTSASVVRR